MVVSCRLHRPVPAKAVEGSSNVASIVSFMLVGPVSSEESVSQMFKDEEGAKGPHSIGLVYIPGSLGRSIMGSSKATNICMHTDHICKHVLGTVHRHRDPIRRGPLHQRKEEYEEVCLACNVKDLTTRRLRPVCQSRPVASCQPIGASGHSRCADDDQKWGRIATAQPKSRLD
jgi:hypothetical protein